MTRIKFMNTEIDNLTMSETLEEINRLIQENKKAYVVTPNIDHIVKLERNSELRKVYKNADLILTDGKPLVWISKIYKTPIKEKVSGSDLLPLLCKMAAEKGYRMYFLGAAQGVAAKAAKKLTERYPGLQIIDTYSPPYGFEKNSDEINKIINMIKGAQPHILIVALGCPKQEQFILKYKEQLDVPISLGLGASLDFEAGTIKRAPKWMCNCGLEWAYRLCKEPKRMFKRYIIDDMKIFRLMMNYRGKN